MIEIPEKISNPMLKYKIIGLICLVIGIILWGYAFQIFIGEMVNFSNLPLDATGKIIVPSSPSAIFSMNVVIPALLGTIALVIGTIFYALPSFTIAKYFLSQIIKPGKDQMQPAFVLEEYAELYEKFGNLYYLIGDYKRSEIFYGVMVLLKQQAFDPGIVRREIEETDKMIYKIKHGEEYVEKPNK